MRKENLKIVIVGGSAGGSTLATTLRRLDESSEIVIIERGPDVSFANCSLPYYFEGLVETIEDLSITTPEQFKSKYNIDARVNEEVLKINRAEKNVEVKNLETNVIYEIFYDYLILSPGGYPKEPKNLMGDNVFSLRNVQDVRDIDKYIKENNVKSVGVIGNGFIGVEVAEAFKLGGMEKVTLFGSRNQVLT
ncbi:MAG: FAD-dependent oxidoreductase, partial [Neofamilia sp.]